MEEGLTRASQDLLGAAALAIDRQDWEEVDALASDALAIEPDNAQAATLRALAERHIGRSAPLSRRHATALFADVVDSTGLAERLDVEAYSAVLRDYERTARPAIDRYDGYVIDVKGDGIVACFGYPTAHEDDAWRAVSAALDIIAALADVSARLLTERGVELRIRVGIDTGLVVVDAAGTVQGAALNRASRLQSLADPDTVVVSAATNELVNDRFETKPLGAHQLRGVSSPVDVFRVTGVRDPAPTMAADPSAVPFVGRRSELRRVLELWEATMAAHAGGSGQGPPGTGAMVLVTGDAGIGKSRFVRAVAELAAGTTQRPVELYCSSYGMTSTLFAFRNGLERYARMRPGDSDEERLEKLEAALANVDVDRADLIPYLGVLLELDLGDRYGAPELAPFQLREAILAALVTLLRAVAARAPLVVMIEDLHWADPTTLELLDRLSRAGVPAGMLILGTARPGLEWAPGPEQAVTIHLDPLRDAEARELAHAAAARPISDEDAQEIVDRGDGVPLFVEQLAHAVGSEPGPGDGQEIVPRTLAQLLQARLDSVGTSKLVAQVAATIGREFDTAILRSVLDKLSDGVGFVPDVALVEPHLARLRDARLVEPIDGGEGWLRFRHILMRDAAYESQLIADRSARHAAAAQALAAAPVSDHALTAFHFDRAGRPLEALSHYLRAVRRARVAGSFAEILSHLERCEELLGAVGDETSRNQFELAVRLNRGLAVSSTQGYAAPSVVEDFGRARDLCELLHDVPGVADDLAKALFGVWSYYTASGDLDTASSVSAALERQIERATMPGGRPGVDACRGVEAFYRGDLEEACDLLGRAVAELEREDVDPAEWPLPNDGLAAACAFLGPLRFLTGDVAGGTEAIATGLARSRSLPFPVGPFSLAFVRTYESYMRRLGGDAAGGAAAAEDVLRIGERYGFFDWQMVGRMHLSAARAMTEQDSAALDDMGEAIAIWRQVGGEALIPGLLVEQAAGYLQRERLDEARACLEDAFAIIDRGQRFPLAEALRLRAELTARAEPGARDQVEADLTKSVEVARAQGAAFTLLRAALTARSLLGVDGAQGPVSSALTEAVAAYADAAPFPELAEARAVLAAGGRDVTAG